MKGKTFDFKLKYPPPLHTLHDVPLPYWGKIPGGLKYGKMIQILGLVNHGSDRFQIDFSRGDRKEDREIALHFNPRFDQRVVVRNSYVRGSWQNEEREPYILPFQQGKDFDILFLVENTHFKIAVNGRHYVEFNHRLPIETIDKLYIEGYIVIKKIEFTFHSYKPSVPIFQPKIFPPEPALPNLPTCTQRPFLPYPSFPQTTPYVSQIEKSASLAQLQAKGPFLPVRTVPQPVFNPKMPFKYLFPGTSQNEPVGYMIYLSGRCNAHANNFRIDFVCRIYNETPPADIALHINPRFEDKVVVRNSFIGHRWGVEERSGGFPFAPGVHFDMIIHILADKFMIAINGKHFTEYRHRVMPVNRIYQFSVHGDVIISGCRFH